MDDHRESEQYERIRRKLESVLEAEGRYFAARRKGAGNPGASPPSTVGRRSFLAAAAAAGGALLPKVVEARVPAGSVERPVPIDPTREQGVPIDDDGGYGSRSQFEKEARWRPPTPTRQSSWTMTPLAQGLGIITPSGLHFERHHAGIATIDPARHSLLLHGMVDNPKKFSMEEIRRFPSISRTMFIECSGNTGLEWSRPTQKTVQGTHGLTSTAEWTGVPLSVLLRQVGVKPGAKWLLAEGADAAVMTRSIPLEKCLDDAFVAYGQNGESIRPEQGYPIRLILPGWEGNTHVKWLRRLEVSDVPYMTRWETSTYTDLLGDGTARQFTFVMEAKSVITFPSPEMRLPGPGFYEITGLAWSGRGKVTRLEVSTDGGKSWADSHLQAPVLSICHTRFRFPWFWDGTPAVLQSRVTDETGYVQPTRKQLVDVRGLNGPNGSIYHFNAIQSWAVATDGSVTNVHV